MKTKSAMITIAGRPNVGKSTLTNALVGEKIAIVSHKPQTTRNRICAILNRKDTQLVFIDTPGFHRPRTKLGDYMVNVVKESIVDVDAILLIVEPIANVGEQELALIEQCKAAGAPTILVINKIDTVEKEALLPVIAAYSAHMDFASVIPISAKWHDGLGTLLEECEKYAQPGPQLFPDDVVTDMPEKQVMADFESGITPILVATTVIEVGVDVAKASCIVIFDADRYGLSQLHQLRGRVGRGGTDSGAFLISRAPADSDAARRLDVIQGTLDGAEIAQADLEFRGAGDVLGDAQSGGKSGLKLLRVVKDVKIIEHARVEATRLVAQDPDLLEHVQLAGAVLDFTRGNETFLTSN